MSEPLQPPMISPLEVPRPGPRVWLFYAVGFGLLGWLFWLATRQQQEFPGVVVENMRELDDADEDDSYNLETDNLETEDEWL